MTTQAQLDAAMKAVMPIVDADIDKGLSDPRLGFFRQRIEQGVHEHRAQILTGVRDILTKGIDAALAVPTEAVVEPAPAPKPTHTTPLSVSPTQEKANVDSGPQRNRDADSPTEGASRRDGTSYRSDR